MRTACTRVDQLFVRISCPIEGKSGTMPIYELKEQQNDPGIYIIIHTLISLIAMVTGLVVVFGMLAGHQLDAWTKWFLITAVATTITGFFFPLIHPGYRSGDYLAAFSRGDHLCPLPEASRRCLAVGLRDWCGYLSLFQSFCPDRAVV